MKSEFVLLLQEVQYHPKSYLSKLYERFEAPSIVRVTRKEEVRKYQKPPLFDDRYLVVFEDLRAFDNNKAFLSFSTMFPVFHVETASQLEDAKFTCKEANIPYQIFKNPFTKEDAFSLIQEHASCRVSDNFCKAVIRQTGLNPLRIITALGVCEQVGYSVATVERYVDKWMYPDIRKAIECLLGVPRSASAVRNTRVYLHINRYWYRYVQRTILDELDAVLEIYKDKLAGLISSESMLGYLEEKKLTRSRIIYALNLFERVSIASVFALREFMKSASLMEVVLRLG